MDSRYILKKLEPTTNDRPASPKNATNTRFDRIEIGWPGKDLASVIRQSPDGQWHLDAARGVTRLHPLEDLEAFGEVKGPGTGLVVSGDRLSALHTLRRWYPKNVRFAYIDAPRIEIDDKEAAFRGDPVYAYSTWLTVVRGHIEAAIPLMSRDGVVAVQVGDLEEPYARLVASECLGRDNYIGTIVWQRSYGPRNMRGMKEFTATHDCIIMFAVDKSKLRPVGLRPGAIAAGFDNSDGDPRGAWRAAHKGARTRRERSDFNTYIPPYRWRIVNGKLPEGLWRLNPQTGVIWGRPTELGDFPIEVEVRDRAGTVATSTILLRCVADGLEPKPPDVPWLFKELTTSGPLRISTRELPPAIIDKCYSAICLADGGEPIVGPPKRPGSGRYWEFADETLRLAYSQDKVDLGDKGDAIPRIKTYEESIGEVVQNQQTWWPAKARDGSAFAGFTQDATKHLKKLRELGLLNEIVTTAKPEQLLARLLSIFTVDDDVVLEMFGAAADLVAVALKTRRRFIYLAGSSDRDNELLAGCALPRLRTIVDGKDNDLDSGDGEINMKDDAYIPFAGGGGFITARVGEWLFEQREREETASMNRSFSDDGKLGAAILTSQGFYPNANDSYLGAALNGGSAVVVRPDQYLTPEVAGSLISISQGTPLTILYFMASQDFDPEQAPEGVRYRRVPSEIVLF